MMRVKRDPKPYTPGEKLGLFNIDCYEERQFVRMRSSSLGAGHISKSMLAERERPIALPPNRQRGDPYERGDDQASHSVRIVRALPTRVHLNQATDAHNDRTCAFNSAHTPRSNHAHTVNVLQRL